MPSFSSIKTGPAGGATDRVGESSSLLHAPRKKKGEEGQGGEQIHESLSPAVFACEVR
jgi:hypothetical protein